MHEFVAAIDQGTTSTRCILFDRAGRIISQAWREHQQIFPRAGWVEHDPLEIWERTEQAVEQALAQASISPEQIAAVGVANQRETTLAWDRDTGKPYYNALVWRDRRTDPICQELAVRGGQDRFRTRVGLPLASSFSGPKLKWLLDNVPGLRQAANAGTAIFGTMDTWLIWNLTGGVSRGAHVTDVTNASRTMLMDLRALDWDEEILEIFGIPRPMLPLIVPSSDPNTWGTTLRNGPFAGMIPVCGALGDQQAALLGQACFNPGEARAAYGAACSLLLHTGGDPVPSGGGFLTTVGYRLGHADPVYALEGAVPIAGALVQWLRDNLGLIASAAEVEALADTVADNGGVYFVLAFSGLHAPYLQPDARGVIVGLTRYANRGHLARAALEATAYQTRELLAAMLEDAGITLTALKVDGGMVHNDLLMQFQADLLGVPVIRPRVAETTALGAAYAAGLAVGFWQDLNELRQNWREDKRWIPQMDADRRHRLYAGWKKAVTRTFDWVERP